jgi:hypothetical protein
MLFMKSITTEFVIVSANEQKAPALFATVPKRLTPITFAPDKVVQKIALAAGDRKSVV